ncbi:allantoinase AllB [Arthrobacter yangruifuii]|uniref:allantoinase AllB n=1 Tax=Arthrobacter yangruifuii TaxID=2606616 RepID=UPI003CCE62A0
MLFTELPLLERPAAARAAGFDTVEFWWPFAEPVPPAAEVADFETAIRDAGVRLGALNFAAGTMPEGERGLLSLPDRGADFRANVEVVAGIGQRLGCRLFNALYGNRSASYRPEEQDKEAQRNLLEAARAVAPFGGTILLEPLSGAPGYPLRTAADVFAVLDRVHRAGAPNAALLADFYHLAVNGDDVGALAAADAGRFGHVQIADAPGRGAPGTGTLPLADWVRVSRSGGYRGEVALEYFAPAESAFDWLDSPGPDSSAARPAECYDLVIRGNAVLTPEGITPAEVGVRDGVIAAVVPLGTGLAGERLLELAGDETLLPGLVDTHVHVNEPGRTEWEGFASATRAAAAGGVTTLIDMPLNSIPPTVTVDALEAKQACAAPQAAVDVGFWGGAVPGNEADLRPLHDAGVFGFKCFLVHSGVNEFPHLEPAEMETVLAELKTFDALLLVHAEDPAAILPVPAGLQYAGFLASRPPSAENSAVGQVIEAGRRTGARAHILHLSSAEALPLIRAAKDDGVRLTAETCPHYLTLTAEEIPDGATAFKCCPPIRGDANREQLWAGLADGTIDCIVSDHSPSTLDLKDLGRGDFSVAWGGVSSLQLGLPLIWTEARARGIPLERVLHWMSAAPAELAGLDRKGGIVPGKDADFAVFAAGDTFTVDPAALQHRNPVTPYAGKQLTGVVRRTLLAGVDVDPGAPAGRLLRRGEAQG